MKKAALLLLLLGVCLLLAACGGKNEATEASPTAETAAAGPAGELAFSGSVTAGGLRVYTDASAYTPYSGRKAFYTRLREGPLEEFVPSPDYGWVHPYAAAYLFNTNQYYDMEPGEPCFWRIGTLYGFADNTGRILTDGLYQEIDDSGYDYANDCWTALPFWVARRVINSEVHKDSYDEFIAVWFGGSDEYCVIAKDGSYALGPFLKAEGFPGGFSAWDYDRKLTVYNERGEPVFDGDRLSEQGVADCVSVQYGEGMYTLFYYPAGETRNDQNAKYCICDETGTIRFGPYEYASVFSDGLACVSEFGESGFSFIDYNGERVLEGLDGDGVFQNGLAMLFAPDDVSRLIDKAGNELQCFDSWGRLAAAPCGYTFIGTRWDRKCRVCLDESGEILCENAACLDENTFCEEGEEGGRIFRLNGQERLLPGLSGIKSWKYKLDGELVEGYLGIREADSTPWFVPADLSEPIPCAELPEEGTMLASNSLAYLGGSFTRVDETEGITWYFLWDGTQWCGTSDSGAELCFPDGFRRVAAAGGLLELVTEEASLMYNAEGELVFCYPLDAQD